MLFEAGLSKRKGIGKCLEDTGGEHGGAGDKSKCGLKTTFGQVAYFSYEKDDLFHTVS